MKKIKLLFFFLIFQQQLSFAQNNFYVSKTGSDSNAGTSNSEPFATMQKAIDAVKNVNKSVAGSTNVIINEGTYSLTSPLILDETVGGNPSHPVTFKAASGATVWISGGFSVTGWTQTSGKPYYQKTLTQNEVRDLYVAGERRTRARTNERITGINWVKTGTTKVGMLIDQNVLPAIAEPSQLELHMQSEWRDAYLPVQSITASNGAWDVRSNRFSQVTSLNPDGAVPTFSLPFFVENALELLDQPGEWCFVRSSKTLYYYPKSGENIATVDVIVPICDKLFDIKGSSLTSKVQNINIEGIRFANTAWNAPSNEGWYGYQSEMLVRPAGVLTPPGAIVLNNASNIVIQNCRIQNTAVSGIAMPNGVNGSKIEGCYFFDNGGAAIQVSNQNLIRIDAAGEEAPANDTIKNNLIVKAGATFYGSPAISSFYTDGLIIDHNTLMQLPYSGISVGFGWTTVSQTCKNNQITNNKIIDYLAICTDGGGIYTLGNQPNSIVANNYVKNGIRDWSALYFDQGSAYYNAYNNVVDDATRWLFIWQASIHHITLSNNWSNVAAFLNRGTDISYESPILVTDGNWPTGAQTVINNSGFEPSYTSLTALLPSTTNQPPVVTIEGSATRSISLLDQLQLKAEVTDDGKPFGLINTVWRKKSGPGTVTFPKAEQYGSTLAFFSTPGTYEIECFAKDNQDSTAASIQVIVSGSSLSGNLALNKTATASSSYDAISYSPSRGVDGNPATSWVPAATDPSFSTWTLDFGSIVAIQRLELDGRREVNFKNTRQHLIFEIADNPSFTNSKLIAYQGEVPFPYQGTWSFNLPTPVLGRYVRMGHSKAGDNGIAEFRAYSAGVVAVSSINVSPAAKTLLINTTQQLTSTIIPSNASNQTITWSTSNASIATVSSTGLVTAVGEGSTTITATTTDGNKVATTTITVILTPILVTGVSVSPTSATLAINTSQQLTATITPSEATNPTISWSSSNTAVATVNSTGLVTALTGGNATITATTQDGNKTASFALTVSSSIPVTSSAVWQSFPVSTQTANFTATFDVVPNSIVTDALTGLQNGVATTFGQLACIVRFSGGIIDARNGAAYTAASTVNYTIGTNYHFRLEINVLTRKYSIYVTPEGQSEIALGIDYAFRGEQANITQLTGWTLVTAGGTHTVKNMKFIAPDVSVASVSVNPVSTTIVVSGSQQLTATIAPTNASNKAVVWSSSNPSVATVNSTGRVTGVSAGTATITATSQDGNKTASSAVTVTNNQQTSTSTWQSFPISTQTGTFTATFDVVPNTTLTDGAIGIQNGSATNFGQLGCIIRFTGNKIDARNGGTYTAASTINYTLGTNYHFRVEINVQTRRYSIYVTPAGQSEITVGLDFAFRSEQANVTQLTGWTLVATAGNHTVKNMKFTVPLTSLSINPATNNLVAGSSQQLASVATPTNATFQYVTWSSSDTSVATVNSNGLLRAVACGSAIITSSTPDGSKIANSSVTVSQPVSNVTLNTASLSMAQLGGTAQLSATVLPANACNQSVTWVSSNPFIATVDANGLVTAIACGTTTITATTVDGGLIASSIVTVSEPVTGITVNNDTLTLNILATSPLTATILPSDACNQGVVWTSSNPSVATVSANGLVTAVSCGTATITATSSEGGFTTTSNVMVSQPVAGVAVNTSTVTLNILETSQLSATIAPSNACFQGITWSSSNITVATVDANGLVRGLAAGSAKVIVTTQDGSFTDTTEIIIRPEVISITGSTTAFSTFIGSPSATQSYTVSGNNLIDDITVIAPAGFEISTNGTSAFNDTLTLAQTSGSVSATTVYVRLTGTNIGSASGNISHEAGTSASLQNVTVSGTVNASLKVKYQNGDNNTNNNIIKPFLTLFNESTSAIPYNEITLRYWFTAENYANINTWIDYAQLGNSKVKMKYVALPQPKTGALGYIEYSFDATAGNLAAGGNSGIIQSRLANGDWSVLNENDDYSFVNSTTLSYSDKITVYRNGSLVWGTEPNSVAAQVNLKVYYENKNTTTTTNSISTYLKINNEGNVPIAYNDVKVRYWFTKDGTQNLNYWIDYAKLGSNNITGTFVSLNPPKTGADTYLEFGFNSNLGTFYPLSSTENIQYRIGKTDWSNFNLSNDYSYLLTNGMTLNDHITVYYQGQLIFGTESSATTSSSRISVEEPLEDSSSMLQLTVLGNPIVNNELTAEFSISEKATVNQIMLSLYDLSGRQIQRLYEGSQVRQQTIKSNVGNLGKGTYLLHLMVDKYQITKKIIITE